MVRRSFLVAAIVASLGLAACYGRNTPSLPVTQSFAPAERSVAHVLVEGVPAIKCDYSTYIGCITVAKAHPAKYTICITAGSSCSSGSFPNEKWSSQITTLKKKVFKGIVGTFKPNPGNPTHGTVTAKVKLKNSKGKVTYVQAVKACPTKGGKCIVDDIGIATK